MRHYFITFWNHLERISVLETDSPGQRRQKVTLVMIALFCCFTGVISIAQNLITLRPIIEVVVPLTFTVIVGTALIIYFYTKRFAILLYSFLTTILCVPAFFQISIGGFSGQGSVPIILWSLLAPFGSLMFQNTRKAAWWFVAYLVLALAVLSLDEYFAQFAEVPISFVETGISHTELMFSQVTVLILLSIIIFITMRYFVNAFQREHARAETLVIDLTQANNELESTLNELKKTQAELVQSEKMAALGKLAAGIAHEINNPIGALKSTASSSTRCISKLEQFLEESAGSAEIRNDVKFQNLVKILKDNSTVSAQVSDRLASTVNSFIDFTRLDKAGFDKVDIHQSIDNTLMLIQHEIKTQITVVKEYGPISEITCYPGELNQVFMNLLKNAAQAIKGDGTITIRTFMEKDNVHVEVADTGIGIPEERLKGLFDPEFDKTGPRVKAGMGLFTNYNIVQKHRGEIKVESAVGKGSTFTIILPVDLKK
jgi:signal transduction histidine kinase